MIKNTDYMEDGLVKLVGFDQINNKDVDYNDGDIAFHMDIRELPISNGSLKINMFVLTACVRGRMEVEINSENHTLDSNSMLICTPNCLITNCMLSPDFDGMILCLSQRIITESLSESDIWNRAFRFSTNPIVHVREDSLKLLKIYGSLFYEYKRNKRKTFQKEIITSIVRAALYEMLSDIDTDTVPVGNNLLRQSDVLFKRFMELLTSCKVKPRTVNWYANRLCVTPKYLSTVCKQVSGKTAFEWINEYVGVDIKHMLKNTNLSIKEITDELNFPNMSFFGKYCRNHFGISPSEYRKQLRERTDE
jgi:AraC-like DNA-binding protein